jgi:hypothetical protein
MVLPLRRDDPMLLHKVGDPLCKVVLTGDKVRVVDHGSFKNARELARVILAEGNETIPACVRAALAPLVRQLHVLDQEIAVALANKMARIAFAIMRGRTTYSTASA